MKKILFIIIFGFLVLAGCSNANDVEQRFRSILDTETGEMLVLGDSSEHIREVLGEPDFIQVSGVRHTYRFLEDADDIFSSAIILFTFDTYYPSMGTTAISIGADNDRFEFQTTVKEVREYFESDGSRFYSRYYDANNNLVDIDDDWLYFVTMHVESDQIVMIMKAYWSYPGSE